MKGYPKVRGAGPSERDEAEIEVVRGEDPQSKLVKMGFSQKNKNF